MSGTAWTSSGQGATVEQLWHASCTLSDKHPRLFERAAARHRVRFAAYGSDAPTNLALTGAPLTAEDLDRIAKCEVGR